MLTVQAGAHPRSARGQVLGAALLVLFVAGCATTPPPEPTPPPPPPVVAPPPPPMTCPTCDEQNRELARLRQDLAAREAEVRDLRAQQRDQAKALQEAARQSARAKVKLRRLASQANAASYIAEVEVALETLRAAPGGSARSAQFAMPQALLDSTAAPFAAGDYATAMDRAAQAEQLVEMLAQAPRRAVVAAPSRAETAFEVALPLRTTTDSHLRRQPRGNAPVLAIVRRASVVTATGYKGNWLHVHTADGQTGWIHVTLLALQ